MVDADDGGFGDFTLAPSNSSIHSRPPMMNGHNFSSAADDDWGDFIVPGGLTHAVSLPRFPNHLDPFRLHSDQKVNGESEPKQPGSAPGRASGVTQWKKPSGALPLSIFGELEEDGKPEGGDPSFGDGGSSFFSSRNVDSVKKVSAPDVNDVIANLFKQNESEPNLNRSCSDDNMSKNEKKSDLNMNARSLSVADLNSNSLVPDFCWNWGNSNGNGETEATLGSQGLNLGWDPLKLNTNGSNSNIDVVKEVIPIANGDNLVSVGGNETFDNADDDDDDDDGWEFKDALANETSVAAENSETNQIKAENGLVVNGNGINTTWNTLRMDFNGWNSNFDSVSSNMNFFDTVDQARDHDAAEDDDDDEDDGWEFKVADSRTQVGNDKIRTEDGPASTISLDKRTSSDLNGGDLDIKPVNLNLFDKNEEFWGNDGWEFKAAGSGNENAEDDKKMPKDLKGSIYTFGFGNGEHGPGDLFGASQGASQEFVEPNSNFTSSSDKSKQNHTENVFPFSQVDEKLGSFESRYTFPEAVTKDEGHNEKVENHKRALPLSIFGDEDKEADELVIHQDSSTSMPSFDLKSSVKNPKVDINDLISSLYGQAVHNTSGIHEQNFSESGLDSSWNGNDGNLASDNIDFDDDSWEFQDAPLGVGDNPCGPVQKYSSKIEQNDYLEFFSKLREELHYTSLYHLENLKNSQGAVSLTDNGAEIHDLDKEIRDLESELQDDILSTEVFSENHAHRDMSFNVFIEALQEPKFQAFGAEYQLTKKLSLAESDWRSAIDVLKRVALIVNILSSASREEQSGYISVWSKMVSVCVQELRHGAFIWKQAMQQNFQDQILSKPQGKKYVLALGEVYRVAKVLESSAKLYKPWILASLADSMFIFTRISECSSLWSSSGLEEALQSISSSADFEYDESVKTLLESIEYIDDLHVQSIYDHVFSRQNPTCQLTALTAGLVPGMKTIDWNGKHVFLTVANLWANLVSSEPPNLPCIHVG